MVDIGDRQTISRVRNVILALCYYKMLIYDTSIQYALEESTKYTVSVKNMCQLKLKWFTFINKLEVLVQRDM